MNDFTFYFDIGWHHIISLDALDHLLFIAALSAIYIYKDWKKVLILVTAFTIGHSVTLALSVFNIVRFPTPIVEFLIPCTIAITAMINLYHQDLNAGSGFINYFLALFFGLIHGMGFANTIRFMLASDQGIGMGLLGFNIGLEVGQILVVALLLLVSYFAITLQKVPQRYWVIFLSSAVFSLALKIVFERIPL